MSDRPTKQDGPFSAIPKVLRALREFAQSRVELLLVELEEERARLINALILVSIGVACTSLAMVLLTITLVVAFWEEHRVAVLGGLTVLFTLSAAAIFWILHRRLVQWRMLSSTLDQLKKDGECFKTDK